MMYARSTVVSHVVAGPRAGGSIRRDSLGQARALPGIVDRQVGIPNGAGVSN